MKKLFSCTLFFILLGSILGGCISEDGLDSITGTVGSNEQFTTLFQLLELTELDGTLSEEGPYTIFAPTDDAFGALPEGLLSSLMEDKDKLAQFILSHVSSGYIDSTALSSYNTLETLSGVGINVVANGNIMVNGSTVVASDIECSNGLIHVIDAVMITQSMQLSENILDTLIERGNFTSLVGSVQAASLVETLSGDGPFTIFAPTDDAFSALPEGVLEDYLSDIPMLTDVLMYHLVNGAFYANELVNREDIQSMQGEKIDIAVNWIIKVNEANIDIIDIECGNGVIHVIDSVILPPSMTMPTVYEVILSDERLSTLASMIDLAGLENALGGEGPFTLLAPTNDAFNLISENMQDDLLSNDEMLTNLLLNHVVPGIYNKTNIDSYGHSIPTATLYGDYFSEDQYSGLEFVQTDIKCDNGVVHLINRVLVPDEYLGPGDIMDELAAKGIFTNLIKALKLADLDDDLTGRGHYTIIAPSDHAFSILPEGMLDNLIADVEELTNLLLYHVIDERFAVEDLMEAEEVESLLGPGLVFSLNAEGKPMVNYHVIIDADIICTNGIIHIVHIVLIPP